MIFLKAYGATAVVFFLVDFVWLTRVAGSFYRREIGSFMLEQPRLGVATIFYVAYVLGIVVFAVMPAFREQSVMTAALLGALLGAVAYGTYDITNFATLRNWPVTVTMIDIAWGTMLTSVSATAGYLALRI